VSVPHNFQLICRGPSNVRERVSLTVQDLMSDTTHCAIMEMSLPRLHWHWQQQQSI